MCKVITVHRNTRSMATATNDSGKERETLRHTPCWADDNDEDIGDLPSTWGQTDSSAMKVEVVDNATKGKTTTQSKALRASAPEWSPTTLKTPLRASAPDFRPACLNTPKQVQEASHKRSSCAGGSAQAMRTSTALQVHRTFSRYDAWMKKQEPYVQAILAWHNTGANKHLFFQSRWVWRGRNFPAAYLETCCADGTPVPLSNQPGCTFPSREAYYSSRHLPLPYVMAPFQPHNKAQRLVPTPYVLAPAKQRRRPHQKGCPRPIRAKHIPYKARSAIVCGTPKPIMRIDSQVHFLYQSHSAAAAAGIPQLRFGSFTPGQELLGGEKPCISTKFTIQDMLKSFQTSEAADSAAPDCAVPACEAAAEEHSAAAEESTPKPGRAEGKAVATVDLHASDSLLESILQWGDRLSLQQETPQKEGKHHSIRPIFNIIVDCTSARSVPSVLDALSSFPLVTSSGSSAAASEAVRSWQEPLEQAQSAAATGEELHLAPTQPIGVPAAASSASPSAGSSAAASEPVRSQEQPLEQAQSAAASEELHLAPTNPSDVPAAASCRASAEEQAAETAEDAAAASSADSVSSMLDESQGMEEMSSEPAPDMHSAADEHIYSALSSAGSSAAASEPMMSQEEPLAPAQSAAAGKELHLVPTQTTGSSAAAPGYGSVEERAAESAEAATAAASSAIPVSSTVDEFEAGDADAAQETSSETAPDMHSAASTADEQSYYSALSSPASSVAASEDMREYDATMEELYLASADDSSEESIPSMLPVQSTSSVMASAGSRAASETVGQQSASRSEALEVQQLAPANRADAPAVADGSESAEGQASMAETDMAEEEAAQPASAEPAPARHSTASKVAASIIKAGCLAGAALEVALEAPVAVSHCLLKKPIPADGGPAVRLYRRATTSAYVAAGHMAGLADAAFAATGAFSRFLF